MDSTLDLCYTYNQNSQILAAKRYIYCAHYLPVHICFSGNIVYGVIFHLRLIVYIQERRSVIIMAGICTTERFTGFPVPSTIQILRLCPSLLPGAEFRSPWCPPQPGGLVD